MQRDVDRVLIDRHAIARRVEALARQIAADVAALGGADAEEPPEIALVPILTGSIIFVSDLIRHLPNRLRVRLISVSSYPGTSTQSKGALLRQEIGSIPEELTGAHVLVVDDILDSGRTLKLVTELLRQRNPASLKVCVLLRKQRPEAMAFAADYVGFDIPDEFVVGYGLDYDDYYRNLPDLVTLTREAIDRPRRQAGVASPTPPVRD